jgi:prepilin-type processing-associated H-X9-DG protein
LASHPLEAYNLQFGSWHPGVCQFVMADGSVQTLANSTDVVVLDRLADRKDANVVELP